MNAAVNIESGPSGLAAPARLGVAEAAQYLGVSKDYVYRKSAAGLIPAYKVGKRLEFELSDLVAYRETKKRGSVEAR
jgi:excisionase family DNA binding protein